MVETIDTRHFSVTEFSLGGDRKSSEKFFHQQQDAHRAWITYRKKADNQPIVVAAVADGIGGYTRRAFPQNITGRNAARMAVRAIGGLVKQLANGDRATSTLLPRAVEEAGSRIYARYNSSHPSSERIGTTLAAVAIKYQQSDDNFVARFAAVGDSPVLLVPQYGQLQRLTTDDHMPNQPRNIISNAIGRHAVTKITPGNSGEHILHHSEQILLATDGVTNATYITRQGTTVKGLEAFLNDQNNWRRVTTREYLLVGKRILSAEKLIREARRFTLDSITNKKIRRDDATAVVIRVK